uniref:DNA helicase n=1 Tax=Cebus imitator TaxID=2715852 RepID=A0A2K5RS23_CEBIM
SGWDGDYKYSGRDGLIFLVDASRATFESQSADELTPFDMSMPCIQSVYISKVISSERDLLAVVFYGTEKGKNSVNFKNINVLQELDNPGAKRILELDHVRSSRDKNLLEVPWVCANLFSDIQFKMSHKRIMLFTNEDNPRGNDSAKASQARTKAGDLLDTGIFLDLMHLKKPGGFDISLFYRDIISIAEDEDLRVHFEESSKLEDLLQKVRTKETRHRLKLKVSKDTVISVGIYNLVQKALKPPPIKLYQETNEPVKTKTQTFNTSTGGLLLPSDTKRSHQIILEKETEEPSLLVYPEEPLVIGSSTLFSALLIKCLEKEEHSADIHPGGTSPLIFWSFYHLLMVKGRCPLLKKFMATPEQVDKIKAIVEKLHFTYRSDSFENPMLQQHFRNLEALALDLMEAEQAVDLTLPKVEAMNKRLGSLVDEFKELVYPPDYNPEGKVTKRKHNNEGSGSKSPKVEYSEEELKTHINKGTLGKFTVPVLKEACQAYGLKSGLKSRSWWKPSPSPSWTDQRPRTLPSFHSVARTWPCSQPVQMCLSRARKRLPDREVEGLYVFEAFCCHGDGVDPPLCCSLLYCLNKEP